MSGQGNVCSGKCYLGNCPSGKCPFRKLSFGETDRWGNVCQGTVRIPCFLNITRVTMNRVVSNPLPNQENCLRSSLRSIPYCKVPHPPLKIINFQLVLGILLFRPTPSILPSKSEIRYEAGLFFFLNFL